MTLSAGDRFGAYEILSLIGTGGMGVVYRALDTRLRREVALKLLPDIADADATAHARLLHEARSAAALNHPNICTVHEVGDAEGVPFIAMEPTTTVATGSPRGRQTVRRLLFGLLGMVRVAT